MKKYIFSKKTSFSNLWNNSLRTYDFIFKVHILDIAWRQQSRSAKWKSLTGEIFNISCPQSGKYAGKLYYSSYPRSGKVLLEQSTILNVHEVQQFYWRTVWYAMPTKRKYLTGELDDISCPRSGKFNWRTLRCLMSAKGKS